MYAQAGTAYVYVCYGIHQMFNVVTNHPGIPDAILIRAVEPIEGVENMLKRTGKIKAEYTLTKGPGNVGKAFGFNKICSGYDLTGHQVFIADDGTWYPDQQIATSSRIGIAYAGADALLPYRFYVKGNRYVSGNRVSLKQ